MNSYYGRSSYYYLYDLEKKSMLPGGLCEPSKLLSDVDLFAKSYESLEEHFNNTIILCYGVSFLSSFLVARNMRSKDEAIFPMYAGFASSALTILLRRAKTTIASLEEFSDDAQLRSILQSSQDAINSCLKSYNVMWTTARNIKAVKNLSGQDRAKALSYLGVSESSYTALMSRVDKSMEDASTKRSILVSIYGLCSVASMVHGYKKHKNENSGKRLAFTVLWGLLGPASLGTAMGQGYCKDK